MEKAPKPREEKGTSFRSKTRLQNRRRIRWTIFALLISLLIVSAALNLSGLFVVALLVLLGFFLTIFLVDAH